MTNQTFEPEKNVVEIRNLIILVSKGMDSNVAKEKTKKWKLRNCVVVKHLKYLCEKW